MEKTSSASPNPHLPSRATQYVRMSTEHQQYSLENQLEVILQYAAAHGMEIVEAYSDHGRSGPKHRRSRGSQPIVSDVENKQGNSSALLVYDVGRWGRFQDVDESAYGEYVPQASRHPRPLFARSSSRMMAACRLPCSKQTTYSAPAPLNSFAHDCGS
jgi:hypothetical protein